MSARRPGSNSIVPIAAVLPTLNTLTMPVVTPDSATPSPLGQLSRAYLRGLWW
jgi:hypothetical protein